MITFRHILFVSEGIANEDQALIQALSLARNAKGQVKILIQFPSLPATMHAHEPGYRQYLEQNIRSALASSRSALKLGESDVPVDIHTESSDMPALRIVQHVLNDGHDLVLKSAALQHKGGGFTAVDMTLLRKCPCPVWLSRPIARHREQMRVAVAIDPVSDTPEGHALSLELLQTSRALADSCSGELEVLACWDYRHEAYLRENPWIRVTEEEISGYVTRERTHHLSALDALVTSSGISGRLSVHHLRGLPEKAIPSFTDKNNTDVLVMGTVARTGIPGFFIGNTAENIVQNIGCSLLAMKPPGFVSPVAQ